MRKLFVTLSIAGMLIGSCGGGGVDSGTTPRNRKASKAPQKVVDYDDENSVGMTDKRVSRWRWKGERKRCYYVVGNECYTTERAACKAAKCRGKRKCVSDSSAPVQVSCKK